MFNENFNMVINGHVLLSGNRTKVVSLIFKQRTTKVLIITQTQFSSGNAITQSWMRLKPVNARPDVKDIYYYTPILSAPQYSRKECIRFTKTVFSFIDIINISSKWQITLRKHAHALCRDFKICKNGNFK